MYRREERFFFSVKSDKRKDHSALSLQQCNEEMVIKFSFVFANIGNMKITHGRKHCSP